MTRSADHPTWEDDASPILPGSFAATHSMGDVPSWMRGEPGMQSGSGSGFAAGEPHASSYPDYYSPSVVGHGCEPHDDGGLGWNLAAWGEAGGFDAVLVGHLAEALGGAAGGGTIVVVPIEHLEINSITQIENTQILFNAANGGSISVGGSVNASGSQSLADGPDGHDFGGPHGGGGGPHGGGDFDFGDDHTLITNDVSLMAGNGTGNLIGGNVIAVADQTLPEAHHF